MRSYPVIVGQTLSETRLSMYGLIESADMLEYNSNTPSPKYMQVYNRLVQCRGTSRWYSHGQADA